MAFLKSVLFGSEGRYEFPRLGVTVAFEGDHFEAEHAEQVAVLKMGNSEQQNLISGVALRCLDSHAFHVLTQDYLHVFVHEMGHALAGRLVADYKPKIFVDTASYGRGDTVFPHSRINSLQKTIISAAGPITDMAFSSCQLVAAVALKNLGAWPLAVLVGMSAFSWMRIELEYAFSGGKDSDFIYIAQNGKKHLIAATAALVITAALGVFVALQYNDAPLIVDCALGVIAAGTLATAIQFNLSIPVANADISS